MRILMASRAFPPDRRGSAPALLFELWERLRERHDVRLVAGWSQDPSLLPADAVAVEVPVVPSLRARGSLALAVRRAALRFRPDVVLAWGIEVPTDVAPTVGLLGDPFAHAASWGRLASLRQRLWVRQIQNMARAVAPSEAARDRLGAFGVDPTGVGVCWPGIDTTQFCPDSAAPPAGGPGLLHVVCSSRMVPGKGQHLVIEAVKGLHPQLRDRVMLDLVGPATDEGYVDTLRRRAQGAPVTFHHDVPDVAPMLRRAALCVLPSTLKEPFGFSALEAMSCGKALVTTRSAALRELTGGRAVEVAAGDVKELGAAIRSLLREPERAAELGRRGRELVLERYSWSSALGRYEALLEEAALRARR